VRVFFRFLILFIVILWQIKRIINSRFIYLLTYLLTDRLAAVWPLIGIIIEVIVLVIFIVICEVKRRKKAAEDETKCK